MATVLETPKASRWLDGLNTAQRAAATHGKADAKGVWSAGPLLVIAGAGTGKTNTLAHRV
ncbi:MAG: helicase, partial [Betaproteobacteria bacterium]|nr:helicase [Betaproteobacteria bacterium]